jgi:hypothetical protein
MFSFPAKRERIVSEQVSGANIRIAYGDFGVGYPLALSQVHPAAIPALYAYHEGDLFTPGAGNFVFEPLFELPLQTVWGFGFLRTPNTFQPSQPPQVYSYPNVVSSGIGGLQAGGITFEPLLYEQGVSE